jgi:hypothetical protein
MNVGLQYVQEQALKAAAHRLQKAAIFTSLNIKQPLLKQRMGKGKGASLVRFEYPGVLSVYDAETGELLAQSEPGKPDVLCASFAPLLP